MSFVVLLSVLLTVFCLDIFVGGALLVVVVEYACVFVITMLVI